MNSNQLFFSFLRHADYQQQAHTPSALQPYALNSLGFQQAAQAADPIAQFAQSQRLQLYPKVFASDALRAWQTANTLAQQLYTKPPFTDQVKTQTTALSVIHEPRLQERSVGALANLTVTQIETVIAQDPRYPNLPQGWKADSQFCLPATGAESLLDAGRRVAEYLQSLCADLSSKITQDTLVILVGHGASFRHAMYELGLFKWQDIARYSMFHARPLFFQYHSGTPKASSNSIEWVAGDWKLRSPKNLTATDFNHID